MIFFLPFFSGQEFSYSLTTKNDTFCLIFDWFKENFLNVPGVPHLRKRFSTTARTSTLIKVKFVLIAVLKISEDVN